MMIPYTQAKAITFKEVAEGGTSLVLSSLEIHTLPDKVEYTVGDLLSFDGLEIYANYANGDETFIKDVTALATPSIAEGIELTEDDTEISFTFSDKGVTKSVSYQITVTASMTSKPIYENGVYGYEEITGKYTVNQSNPGSSSLDGNYVEVRATAASSYWTLIFNYAFDLTDISYIKVTATCNSYAGVNISPTNGNYSGGTKTRWATANGSAVRNQNTGTRFSSETAVNFVIDVRDLTGKYYVRAGCNYNYSQGLMRITKMWLE